MSPPPFPIALGRAYVRLIESAEAIMRLCDADDDHAELRAFVDGYQEALRELLVIVPPEDAANVLAASEKVLGPVREVRLN